MDISWKTLRELEEAHGDSFFLLDLVHFEENYHEFLDAFRSIYPKSNIAYSYKTNYTPKLCQAVDRMGGYAEVVSGMEYELALRCGVLPQRIIFNGPYKRETDIERALLAGSSVNLDSFSEVCLVEAIARRTPDQSITVGLRCNFEISEGKISRFGLDVEGEEFIAALETLNRLPNCRVDGLHCHFSTSDKSVESYALRTRKMLGLAAHHFADNPPAFINVGGGYYGKMSPDFQKQFDGPIATYQEYATAIATQFRSTFDHSSRPELILEPGTAIVADTMTFVAKVVNIKRIRTRRVALVAGSIHNIKPTLHRKTLPMQVFSSVPDSESNEVDSPVDIVGYTCMEHDCLYSGYEGPLAEGDYVVFENVGAYTTVMKPPFIHPFPPIIGMTHSRKQRKFEIAKRQEEPADLFSTYFP